MSDRKRSYLSLLWRSRIRRDKARQRLGQKQFGAESLEDRLVLTTITFDPTPGAPGSGDETVISSSLNFDEGNVLIQDFANLVAGTIDTTKLYLQNSARDFTDNNYEISGVIEADVRWDGSAIMGAGGGGTLTLYYDAANDANDLDGTGFVNGTEIMKATFDASGLDGSPLLRETADENFDQHEQNDYIGVKTDEFLAALDIDGAVASIHPSYFLGADGMALTIEDFNSFNFNSSTKAPFIETDPSMQFELAGGGIVDTSIVTNGDDNAENDLQMHTDGTSAFVLNGDILIHKFLDVDGDGTRDDGEPSMAGVGFTVVGPDGEVQGTTDDDGQLVFENVAPGGYEVTEDVPAGFVATTDNPQSDRVNSQEETVFWFGNAVPGSIHGYKFEDLNGNGEQDAGDPPMPGIDFHVFDAAGEQVGIATTNDNGEFWIEELLPGAYTLCEAANIEYVSSTHDAVTVGDAQCAATHTLTITSGQEYAWREGAAHLGGVVSRHVFYNDSAWDGDGSALSSADDAAIATDKTAFLGTGTATFANYTSYFQGINGIMVDIDHGIGTGATLADFEFRWSPTPSSNDPSSWPTAPAPTMDVRPGDGDLGSTRYSFAWDNETLENGWLQVVVKANANTGIQMDDIHYWGNAVGETGNMVGDTMVNAADISGVVNNPANLITGFAGITDNYDMNRDKEVNAADISIVVNHPANGLTVPQLTLLSDPTQQEMGVWKKEIVVGNDLIFGNAVHGSLHGFKYVDVDADGTYNPDVDRPWEGVEFKFTGTDGKGRDVSSSQTTNENGEFWFEWLYPGDYTVEEVLPPEAVNSTPTSTSGIVLSGQEFVWREGAAHLPSGNVEIWAAGDDFASGWTFNGDAFAGHDGVHLSGGDVDDSVFEFSSGSAIYDTPVDVSTFSSAFIFNIDGNFGIVDASGDTGADGIAFLLQSTGTGVLGGAGEGVGYAGVSPSIAVEFDTWENDAASGFGSDDPSSNHIGISIDGVTKSIATIDVAPDFDNGDNWYAWVDYDGTTLDVYVSLTGIKPGTPALSAAVDITTELGASEAFVGFTSATGGAWGDHDLLEFHWDSPGQGGSLREEIVVGTALMFGNYIPGSIHGFKCEDLNLDGVCEPRTIGDEPHIVFTVDYSGSVEDDSGLDLDGDGINETVLEVEIASIQSYVDWLVSQSINAEIGVVAFADTATILDMDPTDGMAAFTTAAADMDDNGISDVVDALNGHPFGGLTNYQAALEATADLLGQWQFDPADGFVIFISDGVPTVGEAGDDLADEVAAVKALANTLRGFGLNTADLTQLQAIDPEAEILTDPEQLVNIHDFMLPVAGEPPLANMPFELVDAVGNVVATQHTNDHGEFWFTGVTPGHYTLREGDLAGAFPDDNVMPTPGTPAEIEIWVQSHEEYVWRDGAAMLPDDTQRYEVQLGEELVFKNFIKSSIHGFKYHDTRPDGEPVDPQNDPPFPGISFELYDAAGNLVGTETTNDDGEFWFTDLVPGDYHVVEVPHPSGQVKASTHTEAWVNVGSGQEIVWREGAAHIPDGSLREEIVAPWDLSFGNYVLASVHGFKFEDNNVNGIYEPGIDDSWAGFEFLLESDRDGDGLYGDEDPDGEFSAIEMSDENGEFWFTHLEPSQYRLSEINVPDGIIQSPPKMLEIFIESGEEIVWRPGAAMLEPEFLDLDGDATDPNPLYIDSSIKRESFSDPDGNGHWDALTFGNYAPGSIHGFKFDDANVDGVYNPEDGDRPLGGVLFELVQDDNVIDAEVSNLLGEFWFTDLTPGTYTIREVLEHGLVATTDTQWTVDIGSREEWVWRWGAAMLDPNAHQHEVLADGNDNPDDGLGENLMFGNVVTGSLHGFKFEDYDGDGVYEPDVDADPDDGRDMNDKPWANFPFEITGDFDGDGNVESETVHTDDAGEWWLDNLYPGPYTVREKLEDVHEDVVTTTHPQGTAEFFVGSGAELAWREGTAMLDRLEHEVVDERLAFGNAYRGSLHGCVYLDENGNGVVDGGERVVGGVEVALLDGAGNVVETAVTWVDGLYWFEGLSPDWYTVTAINLPGSAVVTADVFEFVGSGEELVHDDGAAHLTADDPQHELNLGSRMFVLVHLPVAMPAPLADAPDVPLIASQVLEVSGPADSQAQTHRLDASLVSYLDERDNLASDEISEDDEDDGLFALLAVDRWFIR